MTSKKHTKVKDYMLSIFLESSSVSLIHSYQRKEIFVVMNLISYFYLFVPGIFVLKIL